MSIDELLYLNSQFYNFRRQVIYYLLEDLKLLIRTIIVYLELTLIWVVKLLHLLF